MSAYSPRCARIFSRTAPAIRSGRLCSSGGRQTTSIVVQPLARRSAAISWASAPQAMISFLAGVSTAAAIRSARVRRRPTRCDQLLRGLDRDGGIAAIGVGAHGLAELLVERRAADEDDVLVAQVLGLQLVDH